jgi:protein-tyrosine phosphatase
MSAGLEALSGRGADPNAIRVTADFGLDLSPHRAQQLSVPLVTAADLILAMDKAQKFEIIRRFPSVSGHVFTLGEEEGVDIEDPYGKPLTKFYESFELIERGTTNWTVKIMALQERYGMSNEQ